MEEDIKILEELRKKLGLYANGEKIKQGQALENLIKGYRELEKRIIQLTNLLCINDSDENYIPKSKIKEIIEELDSKSKYCAISDLTEYMYKKEVLLELLEDK